jgi:mevalonate kinase
MADDVTLIRTLTESFTKQYEWYLQLSDEMRRALSAVVMSQGDLYVLKECFNTKRELIHKIEQERHRLEPFIEQWQQRKKEVRHLAEAQRLDSLLQETERAIQDFLNSEDQLKTYLERLMQKEDTPAQ